MGSGVTWLSCDLSCEGGVGGGRVNLCTVPSSEEETNVLSERKHNPVWSVRV